MDNSNPNISNEILNSAPEKQLMELRKYAIEQGVPPSQVDSYLLEQGWVSQEVKSLINSAAQEQQSPKQAEAPLQTGSELPPQQETGVVSTEQGREQIKGSVEVDDLTDSRNEMERIKKEIGEQESKISREDKEYAETVGQTSEQKENTTTSGTQNTDDGLQKRLDTGVQGYSVSQEVTNNHEEIASKGDVKAAKTWQAALVERLLEMWNSIGKLVSP